MAKKYMNKLDSIGKHIEEIIPSLRYCRTKQDVIDLVDACLLPKMGTSKIIQRDYDKFISEIQSKYNLAGAQSVVTNWYLAGEGNRVIR